MDFILRMFDDLLATLPRKKSYSLVISQSPDLQLGTLGGVKLVLDALMEFSLRIR